MSISYQAEFIGWQNLTLKDLVVAYRKPRFVLQDFVTVVTGFRPTPEWRMSEELALYCEFDLVIDILRAGDATNPLTQETAKTDR